MYAFIQGKLCHASPIYVIIDANHIGYKVFIAANTFSLLPQVGSDILLYTVFIVREQSHTLYGFFTLKECDFFEALLNVTGIGPKTALALIGHLSVLSLQQAISEEDIPTICKVPGIGKKGAERLIIEMRDKIDLYAMSTKSVNTHHSSDPQLRMVNDAMSALINLGYTQSTAQKAVKQALKLKAEITNVSDLISLALKHV